MAIKVKIQAT